MLRDYAARFSQECSEQGIAVEDVSEDGTETRGGRNRCRRGKRRCVFGRLTRFGSVTGDGTLELYLRLVRERVLPVVRAMPGFSGYLALSDGDRGEVLVLTLWASEEQMRASEATTVQLRSQAAAKVGATVLSVERFSVVISELDV
jgi:heme-degrading monooxygenase HmoA